MGKKNRKTRWRTLTITGEHSDSEESSSNQEHRIPKGYQQKSYYNRFTYSSQSTPTRRYQYDGTKSTRSSSTASENKIIFNEDEYTRITTPRQDVLFKKGYLNKPKNYQTQTSTGTSTTSTSNSTGNGTPDHQSTDVEFESQFVFPNGFVDQNGVYYVNSFESYPVMLYNPPTYCSEFSAIKSKRYSTGSLTESTSPHNEEVCQEATQRENLIKTPDPNHVYRLIYPGFYFDNDGCQTQDQADESGPRRLKKKRRRKASRSKSASSELTDESSDEVSSDDQTPLLPDDVEPVSDAQTGEKVDAQKQLLKSLVKDDRPAEAKEGVKEGEESDGAAIEENAPEECPKRSKYDLKPDAEEFVPRAYRQSENIPIDSNVQFIKIPPNFVPVPILNPMGEYNGQNFNHHAFISPGIPVNFIPHNYVNFVPNFAVNRTEGAEDSTETDKDKPVTDGNVQQSAQVQDSSRTNGDPIDIAKIVSKLEEAAKQQNEENKSSQSDGEKTAAKTEGVNEQKSNGSNVRKVNTSNRSYKKVRHQNAKTEDAEQKTNGHGTDPDKRKKPLFVCKQTSSPRKEASFTKCIVNETNPKAAVKNYSDTLKKHQVSSPAMCESHERNTEKHKSVKADVARKEEPPVRNAQPDCRSANQWISVSSRKKRKSRAVEEAENPDAADEKENQPSQNIENALEEDVPATKSTVPAEETQKEADDVEAIDKGDVKIEQELVSAAPPEEKTVEGKSSQRPHNEEENVAEIVKKKPTKNAKAAKKRVMIKDADMSLKTEISNINETIAIDEKIVAAQPVAEKCEERKDENVESKREVSEKKAKKKRNKVSKSNLVSSQSSSSTTLNVMDDTYDFLLENSLLNESLERTNVEVSQELDKIIQRGMFNSLEERMRSSNMVQCNDNFFKTVIHSISSRESSVEKSGYSASGFCKILNSAAQLSKPKLPMIKSNVELPEVIVQHSNSQADNFLGEEPVPDKEDKRAEGEGGGERTETRGQKGETLYPITQAVKEWMTRTRENTPEVEILKSPSTIFKEFCRVRDEETEANQRDSCSSEGEAAVAANDGDGDDEVTVYDFSKEGSTDESPDTLNLTVEEGEDVIEAYESRYGKSEDYLRIKSEVEDYKKTNVTYPKHGNLPYRAICCSIM